MPHKYLTECCMNCNKLLSLSEAVTIWPAISVYILRESNRTENLANMKEPQISYLEQNI